MSSVDPRFTEALYDEDTAAAAKTLRDLCGIIANEPGPLALVVLGSGLADALDRWGTPRAHTTLDALPGVQAPAADGHRNGLAVYTRPQGHVLVAHGRTHLYEGASPSQVSALVRAAAQAGTQAAILCNANGCLRDWELGDVMTIRDHLNFSGASPFTGPLFADISAVWDTTLSRAISTHTQRHGTYALMRGPEYQTRAETRWLAISGADVVGMSTVIEAVTAHALGMRVGGMSVVSDLSFSEAPTDPLAVIAAATRASDTVRAGVEAALAALV